MSDILYGLYSWMRQSFYDDDGGGSRRSERLCFLHSDPEFIRTEMNKFWEHEDLFVGKPREQMKFAEGADKTNTWSSSGGGCLATGGYEIREMKKESAAAYFAGLQETIDRGNAQRADLAERNRKYEEEKQRREKAEADRQAKIEKVRARNDRRRKRRQENRDEVNAKERAYRKELRKRKAEQKLTESERSQKLHDEVDAWRKANNWDQIPEEVFFPMFYKHYPERQPK